MALTQGIREVYILENSQNHQDRAPVVHHAFGVIEGLGIFRFSRLCRPPFLRFCLCGTFFDYSFRCGIPHEKILENIKCKTIFLKARTNISEDGI